MKNGNDHAPDSREALQRLQNELGSIAPVLPSRAGFEIEDRGAGHHLLHCRSSDRACVIESDESHVVHAAFLWDDRPLFAGRFVDRVPLARLLQRWVAERVMPSAMRIEFPELEIDPLADYYERGVPLEGEFVRSWDMIEAFFSEDGGDHFEAARRFIRSLREAGYDRSLRAGQSMSIMGLSRSREQGLRDDQPRLWIEFNGERMDLDANYGPSGLRSHPIRLTPEVKHLLDALADQPVGSD